MRLTFRVTTSGDRWAVAAPTVDFEKVWPKGNGDFDEAIDLLDGKGAAE